MGKTLKCETLIVGAGPAGTSLASYLSGEGIECILIDKKKRIDTPLRCAEYVPAAIGGLFQGPISGISCSTISMDTYIDYKYANTMASPGFMLDRPVFLQSLVNDFKQNGGKFMPCSKAVSFDLENKGNIILDSGRHNAVHGKSRDNNAGMISTVINGPGGEKSIIRSKLVVGADGPNSIVARHIGNTNPTFILGLGENIPVTARDKEKTLIFFSNKIEGGYGWLFPKEGSTNLGIGCQFSQERKNISAKLRKIYKDFKKKVFLMDLFELTGAMARLSPPVEASFTAGLIPASGMMKKTVNGSFILAGDAAGLTNPITGAGIYNAVVSSRIISSAIIKAFKNRNMDFLLDIEKQYHDTFGHSLQRAVLKREELIGNWPGSSGTSGQGESDFNTLVRQCWVSFKDYWKSVQK